jgi:hypothetical protein
MWFTVSDDLSGGKKPPFLGLYQGATGQVSAQKTIPNMICPGYFITTSSGSAPLDNLFSVLSTRPCY